MSFARRETRGGWVEGEGWLSIPLRTRRGWRGHEPGRPGKDRRQRPPRFVGHGDEQ